MLSSKLDSIIFTLMSMIRIWRVSISVEDKYKYLHLKMGSCQIHASGHYLPSSRVDNFSVRHFWKITTVLAPIGCPLHLLSPTCTRKFSHKLFHVHEYMYRKVQRQIHVHKILHKKQFKVAQQKLPGACKSVFFCMWHNFPKMMNTALQNNEYATNDKSECICIIDQWALLIDKIYVTIYYLLGGNAILGHRKICIYTIPESRIIVDS